MEISYHKFFKLPEGAGIRDVLWTTMTLDPMEQLRMIACAHGMDSFALDSATREILRGDIGRFRFFYDENTTNMEAWSRLGDAEHAAMLHKMCRPIRREGGVFHPKLILLRYRLKDQARCRLLVSSRNLTELDAFEVGVQLEGEQADAPNHNLHMLLQMLAQQVVEPSEADCLRAMSEEIAGMRFVSETSPKDEICVTVSGIQSAANAPVVPQCPELVVQWKRENQGGEKLLRILSPDYETAETQFRNHHIYQPEGNTHAKLYYLPASGGQDRLWLGSCNSSHTAMEGKNVECMVRIAREQIPGVSACEEDNTLMVFGRKCSLVTSPGGQKDPASAQLLQDLNRILGELSFSGTEGRTGDGKRSVTVFVTFPPQPKNLPDGTTLTCLPLGMEEKTSNGSKKWKPVIFPVGSRPQQIKFTGAKREALNGLLRVRLSDTASNEAVEQLVVFDSKAQDALLQDKPSESYRKFTCCPWLKRLMEAEEGREAERERQTFWNSLEAVRGTDLREEQTSYLNELAAIYQRAFNVLFSAAQAVPDAAADGKGGCI